MKQFILTILILVICYQSSGQISGRPFLKNYTPKEYGAQSQNWSMVQDDRGVVYVANTTCVLEYDGKEWRSIMLENEAAARAVAKGENGVIYVGGQATFGYLAPNHSGQMNYHSLVDSIPEEHTKFADVWKVHVNDEGVYFMTDYKLFRMKHDGGFDRVWEPKSNSFFLSYMVFDEIFMLESGIGLMKLDNDEFSLVRGGEELASILIYAMEPFLDNKILIATAKQGIYIYDRAGDGAFPVYPLGGNLKDVLKNYVLYSAKKLKDNLFALGTLTDGVFIMNQYGDKVFKINQENGLQNNRVWDIQSDVQGGLWACLNKGISRVELNTPFTYWSDEDKVGKIFGIEKFQGRIYIATGQHVAYYDERKAAFHPVEGLSNQCWTFHKYKNGEEECLLIGSHIGVFELREDKAYLIEKTTGGFDIFQSKRFPNRLFFATPRGLGVLKKENGSFKFEGMVTGIEEEVRSIGEDATSIYLGTFHSGVYQLDFASESPLQATIQQYDTLNGLPSLKENNVISLNGGLCFTTSEGLYEFDKGKKQFRPSLRLGEELTSPHAKDLQMFTHNMHDEVWYQKGWGELGRINLITKKLDTTVLRRLPDMEVNTVYADDENHITWIGGSEGLYCFRKDEIMSMPEYPVVLRGILVNHDTLIYEGAYVVKNSKAGGLLQSVYDIPIMPYKIASKSMEFHFAATSYDDNAMNEYKYALDKEGFFLSEIGDWSAWSTKAEKEYTNLSEGEYTFRVLARNVYGIESSELIYRFEILPPWYRTVYAYILYTIIGLLGIWGVVRLNTARLKKVNLKLEGLVEERTAQIRKQNVRLVAQTEEIAFQNKELHHKQEEILTQHEELQQQQEEIVAQKEYIEKQNDSLQEQNLRITDSIRYAKTIQKGILPFPSRLDEHLVDHFILYRPKDIVSGDFYWYERYGNQNYFVVADCTGHGVPGAFMSMMGSTMLSEVISKSQDLSLADILAKLDALIVKSLKQEYENGNKDGIDLALVSWCDSGQDVVKLRYSGAHRPLYYFSKNELHDVKGINRSIGGIRMSKKDYAEHTVLLDKGDAIFLTSDGYADQNNEHRKKVGRKKLKAMFSVHAQESMNQIRHALEEFLDEHQGPEEQRDDITVVGIRF